MKFNRIVKSVPPGHPMLPAQRRVDTTNRRGLSLVELLVVLLILVATSIIVLPILTTNVMSPSGKSKTANEITTESTMQVIREAMVGEAGVLENLANHPDALPRTVSELVRENPPKHVEKTAPQLIKFDPIYGVGWHGPYLRPTGKNVEGEPTLVDGWGQEIELQVDFDADGRVDEQESKFIRLVSAGPNGQIETPSDRLNMEPGADGNQQLTLSECGDDLVMFLRIPDYRK